MDKVNKSNENQIQLLEQLKDENFQLDKVQEYIKNVLDIRGLSSNSTLEEMLLLVEEVGELAKAIRKEKVGMATDNNRASNYDSVESEIADVLILLIGLCNSMDISIKEALYNKEKVNSERVWRKK